MVRLGLRLASLGVVVVFAALLLPAPRTEGDTGRNGRLILSPGKAAEGLSRGVAQSAYGRLPMAFEANRGQTDPRVKFLARGQGYTLFLTAQETVFVLRKPQNQGTAPIQDLDNAATRRRDSPPLQASVLRTRLVGANLQPQVGALEELPGKVNYFIGNDPTKWATSIPTYAKVRYRAIYPGVDLVYYGGKQGLEYDFVVAPRADPAAIRMSFEGMDRLEVDAQGDLILHVAGGQIRQFRPRVYQEVAGSRHEIAGRYVRTGKNQVTVRVGAYNASRPLVIDPVLSYSTYLGGSANERGTAIAVDSRRNAYVTGFTASANFPTTTGAFQTTFVGAFDVFVTKINATGSALVYSTYLGGSMPPSSDSEGWGITVDGSGNAYVTGLTNATSFPTFNALQATYGGGLFDAFVTKLNATGSALIYSTYLGGTGDDEAYAIAVDSSGNAYLTGLTNSTNFPVVNAVQSTYGGGPFDAFVTKINATGSALVYSTYLGGGGDDEGYGIALDASGNAYVTGLTSSTNFLTTTGAFQTTYGGGGADAYITKFSPTGSVVYSTFLGGNLVDVGRAIAVDSAGNAYVGGHTNSTNFPGASSSTIQPTFAGGARDGFVTKINSTGSALIYSTYLGGAFEDRILDIAVDSVGGAYVTGFTLSTNFPTVNALQPNFAGGSVFGDAFVAKINPQGTALVFSTYLGGSIEDQANGVAVDASKNVYVVGRTNSGNFPTRNPLQLNLAGGFDAFVTRISPVQKVALYNPATATFYARRTNTSGTADASVTYGPANAGWFPLVGDWTGQGMQTIGLYNPMTATFYLRNSNTPGVADIVFTYGPANAGWFPLVGDWTGSGVQTVGLYDSTTATFYLRNSNSTGQADIIFTYGPAQVGCPNPSCWIPLVGDWTGQGVQTVGLYDPTTARFFLRNSNSTGQADTIFTYGPANMGWFPLVGDWTGLGVQTIGLFNAVTATNYLRNSNTAGQADILVNFGPGGPPTPPWLPGDVNWDGL